jgi:hypothetical protein
LDEFLVGATCKILFEYPGFSLAKLLSASIGGLNCLAFLGGIGGLIWSSLSLGVSAANFSLSFLAALAVQS